MIGHTQEKMDREHSSILTCLRKPLRQQAEQLFGEPFVYKK